MQVKDGTYDESRDAFIPAKPFASWVLNEDTCQWEAPISKPLDKPYMWNEENQSWDPSRIILGINNI